MFSPSIPSIRQAQRYLAVWAALGCYLSNQYALSADDQKGGGVLTDKDNKQEITLAAGSPFTVKLQVKPGTGYFYEVMKYDEKVLTVAKKPYLEQGKNLPGATELQVFEFIAAGPGKTTLVLHYLPPRPQQNEKPEKVYQLEVVVQPAR